MRRLFTLKPLDIVRVKGRSAGIRIFTVIDAKEEAGAKAELELWDEAFTLYANGDFALPNRICLELRKNNPDEKLYRIFEERTGTMAQNMPECWDGVFIYEDK